MQGKPFFVVFLGAPGAGKGTQAKLLEKATGLPQVSTGDIFREHLRKETELGLLAKTYMDKGELVPDEVTVAMVKDRLSRPDCASGALLDGFPRTVHQAEALDEVAASFGGRVGVVLYLKVPEEALIQRLSGRRICRNCGAVYHEVFNPPKVAGICDLCGGELYQRADDSEETARNRLQVYFRKTMPVIAFYRQRGLLREINGNCKVDDVQAALIAVVESVKLQ